MHVWYSTVLANMRKSLYTLYIGWTVSATASIVLLLASRVVISSSKYYCSAQKCRDQFITWNGYAGSIAKYDQASTRSWHQLVYV